ncbi:nitroreductase [Actinokineospora auranticolor]|uniref:Nitroreductase family protein n=1 Tax=Actinokineospora auranticolor TaxID=155976 RepID=A0A2S6GKM6_9PSEU|nr:nitroreductase [Actinokineospora auranticolor]PPK65696.1 hypothetical protein CLV40_113180 [Actinokineospora auranticolor]
MPTDSEVDQVIHRALAAATRAPSVHNSQPWRFARRGRVIEVWLDRDRVLAVVDPHGHEARLSCGAALYTLRLALAVDGFAARVRVRPDGERDDLLAEVELDVRHRPTEQERTLAAAVPRRHTNRRPFLDRAVPERLRVPLARAAAAEGARLVLVDRPELFTPVADLIRRADRVQSGDPAYRAELRSWLAGPGRADGVPASALGRSPTPGGLVALRDFGAPEADFERVPLLAVLTTLGDTPADQVVAGQAMQRVLLTATASGLAVSPLSQPVEVPTTRRALGALVGGMVHTVLRIGYGHVGSPTRRRAVEEVAG